MFDKRLAAARTEAAPAHATPSRDRTGWFAGGSGTALTVRWAGDTPARPHRVRPP
ncbi:hypothetical protein GCM10009830_03680 [Glycomyces endophyticus]|uniref:Uncharacterized protein n=1 Tax=Glycomyces endophyticus TaxID=480996 RepID=A0ABP4RV39_9ACTN